ncbi:ubiquinone anaerobic biosynthesis accessory factor UbiT [Aerolutibacter ruishenii]|uniref:Ubiquinone biosynthesis accessory factor UbiT n=1 Tax=Aerolutibacter ruishenii TaxID=686800 RepID=A0A562LYA1_9GAMM|nr:SCP2 sterol-binding domain-containing protein [Lysobacter ruishenii]TWI12498.1 putative lipid carrier protein YhbT [Lysobacter ruishenii]
MTENMPGLAQVRRAIDGVDDGLVLLLAARSRLARVAGRIKARAGAGGRDEAREQRVRQRAASLATALGLEPEVATGILELAIGAACRDQGLTNDLDQGGTGGSGRMIASTMHTRSDPTPARAQQLLRFVPPPRRIAPLLRVVPLAVQQRLLERAMAKVLSGPLNGGALEFMAGRRLGIEVSDLALRWVVELQGSRLVVVDAPAEATVRGTVTDLLLLAGRLEDADTLFFQRRLVLTGDTELGLTARNVLDRLPWERVPLGLRIALNRGARFASAARSAHRAGGGANT